MDSCSFKNYAHIPMNSTIKIQYKFLRFKSLKLIEFKIFFINFLFFRQRAH